MLTGILRDGAQRLLSQAIEAEVQAWLESHQHIVDEDGHRQVVGNGRLPARTIITGVGPVEVSRRRVHDRRIVGENDEGQAVDVQGQPVERFRSKILPPYLRKTKSIEELIPWLYLKGVSTGDFTEALSALPGKDAPGLSAATMLERTLKQTGLNILNRIMGLILAAVSVQFVVSGIHDVLPQVLGGVRDSAG